MRYAVIVDPLSTGQEYPAAFRAAGVEPVAVLSRAEPPEAFRASWHPERFRHIHVFDGDLDGLADTLRGYRPLCVVPGTETGVDLADLLVERVVPGSGNVFALTEARRDKWAMARAVAGAGVAHLRQTCDSDPDRIEAWLRDAGLDDQRLVVKPPRSAGTDNVHIVPSGVDWRPYFDLVHGQANQLGSHNEAVLVSEFAEGTEYLVDSYSVDGRHGLVDVCRYTKTRRGDRIGIYDLVDFLPPEHPEVAAVWPYTRQVLDAVGIRNGCGHTEVIVTAAGPRLLEVAARPAGGGHQMITMLATGANHITRTVAHRAHGAFAESYRLIRHVCSVVISSPRAGIWRNGSLFDAVDALPTFHLKHFAHGTGDLVPATDDLYTYLGWVVLAGADPQAIDRDYRWIKELERQIVVEPAAPAPTPRPAVAG